MQAKITRTAQERLLCPAPGVALGTVGQVAPCDAQTARGGELLAWPPYFFSFLAVRLEVACVGNTTLSLGGAREVLAL